MLRIQKGDRKYFEYLYDRYQNKLFNFIYRFVGDREQAEDLMHDLFIKVIESTNQFDTNRKFSTWIYALSINLCRNEIRKHSNRKQLIEENFVIENFMNPDQQENIDKKTFKNEVHKYLETLNEENKSLILLRFHEDLSIPQISTIINLPEGTVKSRLFYLLKKIAVKLNAFHPSN